MDDARSAGSAWLPSARRLVSWASRDSERRWARELCGVGVQGHRATVSWRLGFGCRSWSHGAHDGSGSVLALLGMAGASGLARDGRSLLRPR